MKSANRVLSALVEASHRGTPVYIIVTDKESMGGHRGRNHAAQLLKGFWGRQAIAGERRGETGWRREGRREVRRKERKGGKSKRG